MMIVFGVLLFAFVGIIFVAIVNTPSQKKQKENTQSAREQKVRESGTVTFNNMNPAQHLAQAELALKPNTSLDAIDEGLRNLDAIPPYAPEAVPAKGLRHKFNLEKERQKAAQEKQAQEAFKQNILNDARKTARKNYMDGLREEFRNNGVDASVYGENGDLMIVSGLLKRKRDRDIVMLQQFGPNVRRSLCAMGFKTLALQSGVVFGEGETYSLGCAETKTQREARLEQQRTTRQKYVDSLQFGDDLDIHATQEGDELVLTGSFANGLSPEMFRVTWGAKFDNEAKKNLCGIGFRGIRIRTDANSAGTFISFNCGGH